MCVYVYTTHTHTYIHHIFLIQSSVGGHLVCFCILAIVNNAAMNTGGHVSFHLTFSFSSGIYLGGGTAGLYGSSIFSFWRTSILLSTVAARIYIPTNSVQGFLFLQSSPTFVICVLFDDSTSDSCEVISHCSFNLIFFISNVEHLSMCLMAICIPSLEQCLFRSSVPFLTRLFFEIQFT